MIGAQARATSRDSQVDIWQVHPLSQLNELRLQITVMRASPLRVDDFPNLHGTHDTQRQASRRLHMCVAVASRRAQATAGSMTGPSSAQQGASAAQWQPAAGAAALCWSTYHIQLIADNLQTESLIVTSTVNLHKAKRRGRSVGAS